MARRRRILERILNVVRKSVFGITFEELIRRTGHHRATVRKYVRFLERLGFVVSRKIGNYTLIFPTSIYNCIRYDFSGLYLDSLIHVLSEKFGFDKERVFELSKSVSREFIGHIYNIVRETILRIQLELEEITDVLIPTVTSHIEFRIRRFSMTDRLLYLEIHNAKTIMSSMDLACEFLRGHIAGVLESLGVEYKSIELLEKTKRDDRVNCNLVIILKEPIHVIREKLGLNKDNYNSEQ